jgi:outer membrane protein
MFSKCLYTLHVTVMVLFLSILFISPCFSVCAEENADTVTSTVSVKNVLEITLGDAILMALENNRALKVERLTPSITETYEEQESAVFDPSLSAGLSASRERSTETTDVTDGVTGVSVGISRFFPTGTEVFAGLSADRNWSDLYSDRYSTGLGLTVTQSLLRGAGRDFNLASVRQARLNTLSSHYELRGFTEFLISEVERTYWRYALALKQIEIYEQSLELAEQQLKEIREKIDVGTLAEIEIAAAEAEVSLRNESLINAHSNLESIRLQLLRLLNPSAGWGYKIVLKNMPAVPDVKLDGVESHSAVALRMRSDVNQARLSLQRGDLEVVKTRNGLLPKMDLFISLGKTGYADSFGSSVQDIGGESYGVSAGIAFEWPFGNRDAEAQHKRTVLSLQQAEESLKNLSQLAELDVRLAYIEVDRVSQQIEATAVTRKLQEEKLRAETEKFRVGRSTALLVAQAQRDLLNAQISEVEAVVNYLNSLVDLFYLEGSLLERRGISTASFQ